MLPSFQVEHPSCVQAVSWDQAVPLSTAGKVLQAWQVPLAGGKYKRTKSDIAVENRHLKV